MISGRRRVLLSAAFIAAAWHMVLPATGADSIRNREINECGSGEIVTWGDGRDRPVGASSLKFAYNPVGAPEWFSANRVYAAVERAAEAWSACGIETQMVPWNARLAAQRDIVTVSWSDAESRGNFGLADFTRRTLSLGPKAFGLLKSRNPTYDAGQTLQLVISHEMGHLFGLMAHSRRCIDVLSYYDNGRGEACFSRDPLWKSRTAEYRSTLPTACDIERCRTINGKALRKQR